MQGAVSLKNGWKAQDRRGGGGGKVGVEGVAGAERGRRKYEALGEGWEKFPKLCSFRPLKRFLYQGWREMERQGGWRGGGCGGGGRGWLRKKGAGAGGARIEPAIR